MGFQIIGMLALDFVPNLFRTPFDLVVKSGVKMRELGSFCCRFYLYSICIPVLAVQTANGNDCKSRIYMSDIIDYGLYIVSETVCSNGSIL